MKQVLTDKAKALMGIKGNSGKEWIISERKTLMLLVTPNIFNLCAENCLILEGTSVLFDKTNAREIVSNFIIRQNKIQYTPEDIEVCNILSANLNYDLYYAIAQRR